MSDPPGQWTPEQLRVAVGDQPTLMPAHSATIGIERLERSGPDGDGVLTEIEVRHRDGVERWRLTFASMWADVSDFPLADAALMVRANVVEWWETRIAEPEPPWLTTERIA